MRKVSWKVFVKVKGNVRVFRFSFILDLVKGELIMFVDGFDVECRVLRKGY